MNKKEKNQKTKYARCIKRVIIISAVSHFCS